MQHHAVDAVAEQVGHQRIELQLPEDGLHLCMVGFGTGLFGRGG